MEQINLTAAWIGISFGFISGVLIGLKFHQESWKGGYWSWSRRLIRLAHISFFGLGFINLAYALSVRALNIQDIGNLPGLLLIIGAITMPTVCYLSAWRKVFRHFFALPVVSLLSGVIIFIIKGDLL